MAFIVPDGQARPKTIREYSHKVVLNRDVIVQIVNRVMGYKIIKLENVPNLAEHKKSIICVARKRK